MSVVKDFDDAMRELYANNPRELAHLEAREKAFALEEDMRSRVLYRAFGLRKEANTVEELARAQREKRWPELVLVGRDGQLTMMNMENALRACLLGAKLL